MARAGIFISTKDVQTLTGLGPTRAWKILSDIKVALKKEKHQHITLVEYCTYEGVPEEMVKTALNRK